MENSTYKNQHTTGGTTYRHIIKYTGIFGGVQGLKMAVSVVRNKLTTHFLGQVGLGLITVYTSITDFIVNSSNLGFPLNATRESSELYNDSESAKRKRLACILRTWVIWTSVFSALVTLAFSPVLSYFFFDKDTDHAFVITALIPIIISRLIAEVECSMLKGYRRLKSVATLESLSAIATLFFTIPFYILWGLKGVIWGLITSSMVTCCIHLYYSTRFLPYEISPFSRSIFREGIPLVKKGVPYMISGIITAFVAMLIPMLILSDNSMGDVGLFRAGYTIIVTYAGLAFVALETDYFPRLSSSNHDLTNMNRAINQQAKVCLMLITPLAILLLMFMPLIIPILYDNSFLIVEDMACCAIFYLFFRAIMLPVSYTPLAKGDSMTFLVMEVVANLVFFTSTWAAYKTWGITGIGVSLSVSAFLEMMINCIVYKHIYGCTLDKATISMGIYQFINLSLAVAAVFYMESWYYRYAVLGFILLISLLKTRSGLLAEKKETRHNG